MFPRIRNFSCKMLQCFTKDGPFLVTTSHAHSSTTGIPPAPAVFATFLNGSLGSLAVGFHAIAIATSYRYISRVSAGTSFALHRTTRRFVALQAQPSLWATLGGSASSPQASSPRSSVGGIRGSIVLTRNTNGTTDSRFGAHG